MTPNRTNTIVTYRGTVYPWHCDHMGHMNVTWYVSKFDEALWSLFLEIGLTPSYLRCEARGMAALQQSIQYHRELLAGDVVEIRGCVQELRDKVVIVKQVMHNAEHGHAAATMELTGVHLDTQTRKAIAFPKAIRAAIENRFPAVARRDVESDRPLSPCGRGLG